MEKMKGQAFILGSVIFSGIMVLAFITTGPEIVSELSNTENYFSQTLDESFKSFNSALEQNRSIENAKRKIYSYDRFVERQSLAKGIDYTSYSLAILPGKGEAVIVNYREQKHDYNLQINGNWNNFSIPPKQNNVTEFNRGNTSVVLEVPKDSRSYSFSAATPKLLKHASMNSTDEDWKKTVIG